MLLFLLLLCLLCFLCLFSPASTSELCFHSSCNGDFQTIQFPFRIENQQPKSCGYPGFDLTCPSTGQPLLHLPSSGDFTVQYIDYENQEILVNDPNKCLPRKILSLELSGSPFHATNSEDFTFFNCSWSDPIPSEFNLNPIYCLSGLSYAVFASPSSFVNEILSSSCVAMKTVSVPYSWSFSADLTNDLRLGWKKPNCRRCESQGGICGLAPNSTDQIQCKHSAQPRHGIPRGARYAVSIGVGVPVSMCILGFLCCFCARVGSYSRGRNSSIEAHWVISSRPTLMGLDEPTIDSYPKIELGESLRLPKPNDNICAICLSEYRPKETVKSIPQCQHFFHQDCIHEWLRLNPSCPVCRMPPVKSPPSDSSL
ncbi:RING-H2 finger protein ATL22-like [Cucurbita moschata]|uniref:RING-type E3 ubiquitin transferase n=1 Tax=Cucurbita moschata TaxID=3662 RepID=A0A6J1E4R1_CUCMO|nr:RING-H2 finger protein ATL22-like [Cucurbita moschata]